MKMRMILPILLLLLAALALASYTSAGTASMPAAHPDAGDVLICSQCHTDWRASMDHTAGFGGIRHKMSAWQYKQACGLCHRESFCSDCHAHRDQMKPSDKYKDAPERTLPHRGNYLNQHKIDGKINPASCMRCHGRQNNERCRTCHR